MIVIVRTTITVDDRLHAELKRRAAECHTTMSKLVEHALQLFVQSSGRSAAPESFTLVTFGAGGRFTRRNIDKVGTLLEADDLERFTLN
jgi:hypothetical protein